MQAPEQSMTRDAVPVRSLCFLTDYLRVGHLSRRGMGEGVRSNLGFALYSFSLDLSRWRNDSLVPINVSDTLFSPVFLFRQFRVQALVVPPLLITSEDV